MKKRMFLLLLLGIPLFAQRVPSDVKVSHIGPRLVGISCRDGVDATVDPVLTKQAGMLVVSCGKQ